MFIYKNIGINIIIYIEKNNNFDTIHLNNIYTFSRRKK